MMSQDEEQLMLLSIFHYVVAGLAALFALLPLIHLVIGLAMVTGRIDGGDKIAELMGWLFVVFAGVWIIAGLVFSVLLVVSGRNLVRHQHHMFCLVMAALACMFIPFGTVLGVFTIILLMRDSVKILFGKPGAMKAEDE